MGLPQGKRLFCVHTLLAIAGVLLIVPWLASRNQASAQEIKTETPKLDIYGDPLPEGAIARLGTLRLRHNIFGIGSVAFSPDGTMVASGGKDQTARLWYTKTGKEVRRLQAADDSMSLVAFSPKGDILATAGFGGIVRLWNVANGKEICRLRENSRAFIYSLAFSKDGRYLAAGADRSVYLFDVDKQTELFAVGHQGNVKSLAFTPDGRTLATATDDQVAKLVYFLDVPTGRETRDRMSFDQLIYAIAISPDGNTLAVSTWRDGIKLRNLKTGNEIATVPQSATFILFSPNGKTLAANGPKNSLILWDTATQKKVRDFSGHVGRIQSAAFSRDGMTLATAGRGAVRLWDVETAKEKLLFRAHEGSPVRADFSRDGVKVLTSSGHLFLWDCDSGKQLQEFPILTANFSSVQEAQRSGLASLHSLSLSDIAKARPVPEERHSDYSVYAHSPDGKMIAFSGIGGRLFLQSSMDPLIRELRWPHAAGDQVDPRWLIDNKYVSLVQISALAYSANRKFVAAAGAGQHIYVWRVDDGKPMRGVKLPGRPDGGRSQVTSLSLSSDGRFLAASVEGPYDTYVWNLERGKLLRHFPGPRTGVSALSPDGKYLATASGHLLRLWELAAEDEVCTLAGHADKIYFLSFSPRGDRLLSGAWDQTALIWDLSALPNLSAAIPTGGLGPKRLAELWDDLNNTDAPTAYRAAQILAASPKETVQYFQSRLHPAPMPNEKQIRKSLAELDSELFEIREMAFLELQKLGRKAEPQLLEAREGKMSEEARQRVATLLLALEKEPLPQDHLRRIRAIQILEQIPLTEARHYLQAIAAGGAWAQITQDAKAALERIRNHRFTRKEGNP